ARKSVRDVVRILPVAVLRIDPGALRLTRERAVTLHLALARAPDDAAVGPRPDPSRLASRGLRPGLRRAVPAPRLRRQARDDNRRVVLLWTVEAIRILIVDRDHVDLRGRLVQDRRPRASAVRRHRCAAVIALNRDIRVI